MLTSELVAQLGAKRVGKGWQAKCPAHDDANPSLSIADGADGRVLLNCFAGCSNEAIVAALGLKMADLFTDTGTGRDILATYPYCDEHGTVLFEVLRLAPKAFRQRRPDGLGGWTWKLDGVRRVLYHLPQLRAAVAAGKRVFVVEGERDVHSVEAAGYAATTNPGGAGRWRAAYSASLKGADVVIVADKDTPGRAHAKQIATALQHVATKIVIVEPAAGKDVSDHLAAGKTLAELVPVVAEVPKPQVPRPEAKQEIKLEPWPEPVDGPSLLKAVEDFVWRFVVMPRAACRVVAAWIVATYAVDRFDVAPLLLLRSPVKRCGKTKLLEVLALLVQRPLNAVGVSPAALFRIIAARQPTLLIDEAEVLRGKSDRGEALREILNAGHTRLSVVLRCDGDSHAVREFPVFGFKVLAAIGRLWDTLEDRAIVLELVRKTKTEQAERLRRRGVEPDAQRLRRQLVRWAQDHGQALAAALPPLPDFLDDRAADSWEVLLAVGQVAGGEWYETLAEAARTLMAKRDEDESDPALQLLADIHTVFVTRQADKLMSADLAEALTELEGQPWAEWHGRPLTVNGLAGLLRRFGIRPGSTRIGTDTAKGYHARQFTEAWERFGNVTTSQPAPTLDETRDVSFFGQPPKTPNVTGKPAPPLDCDVVTFREAPQGGAAA
jgi:5S rRNA maturation endonuclease (ribonuclease M5)